MAEQILRIRPIDPSKLLSEETILQQSRNDNNPFLGLGDRPEPYRTQYIAYYRRLPVLQQEKLESSQLVVDTPRGRGLVWRWFPNSIGVVLMKRVGNEWMLEENVTFLDPSEYADVKADLTMLVLNPPKW